MPAVLLAAKPCWSRDASPKLDLRSTAVVTRFINQLGVPLSSLSMVYRCFRCYWLTPGRTPVSRTADDRKPMVRIYLRGLRRRVLGKSAVLEMAVLSLDIAGFEVQGV